MEGAEGGGFVVLLSEEWSWTATWFGTHRPRAYPCQEVDFARKPAWMVAVPRERTRAKTSVGVFPGLALRGSGVAPAAPIVGVVPGSAQRESGVALANAIVGVAPGSALRESGAASTSAIVGVVPGLALGESGVASVNAKVGVVPGLAQKESGVASVTAIVGVVQGEGKEQELGASADTQAGAQAAPKHTPATSSKVDFEASVAAEVQRRVQEELTKLKMLTEVQQEEEFKAQQGQVEARVVAVAGRSPPGQSPQ